MRCSASKHYPPTDNSSCVAGITGLLHHCPACFDEMVVSLTSPVLAFKLTFPDLCLLSAEIPGVSHGTQHHGYS
jgi:hypothetical protein